jgi:hypothetical protein
VNPLRESRDPGRSEMGKVINDDHYFYPFLEH